MTLPSRHRRLDGALADLPLEEPMLLTELDGFLTGVLLSPDPVPQAEWMRNVWGADEGGVAAFEDPLDVQWFADAVMARRDEIARDLGRDRLQPIFGIDARNGERLWEGWIDGFAEAMALRPAAWDALAEGDADAARALDRLAVLVAVADDDGTLDGREIDALHDRAAGDLVEDVIRLHAARRRIAGAVPAGAVPAGAGAAGAGAAAKVGRNEPCPCGSGRKSKRCCGQG